MLSKRRLVPACLMFAPHLRRGRAERYRNRDLHQIIPHAYSRSPGELQRPVVGELESLHYVPGLAFHDGYLFRVHAFLEVIVLRKASSKGELCVTPPLFGGEERQEVATSRVRERLADEGHREEEPAKGVAAPLDQC